MLVFAVQPTLTNAQVVDLLQKNNEDLEAVGYDLSFGYGRGNIYKTPTVACASTPVIDTTPPSGSIVSPANNSKVSGTVNSAVTATDNIGLSKVKLYIDGKLLGTDTSVPYIFSWNTKRVNAGAHTLHAKSYDAAGNVGSAVLEALYR